MGKGSVPVESWVLCHENQRKSTGGRHQSIEKVIVLLLKKYHLINSVADLKGAPRERKFSNEHFMACLLRSFQTYQQSTSSTRMGFHKDKILCFD